jgi:hypothetical protein
VVSLKREFAKSLRNGGAMPVAFRIEEAPTIARRLARAFCKCQNRISHRIRRRVCQFLTDSSIYHSHASGTNVRCAGPRQSALLPVLPTLQILAASMSDLSRDDWYGQALSVHTAFGSGIVLQCLYRLNNRGGSSGAGRIATWPRTASGRRGASPT